MYSFHLFMSPGTKVQGWTKREQDMRALIDEMGVALVSPPAFREKVKAEFDGSLFSA